MTRAGVPEFSCVYEAYHARVLAYAASLIGREDAEDVAQEVFVKIGRSLGGLADPSRLSSWIYAITLNTVRDAARRRASRPDRSPAGSGPPQEGGDGDAPFSRLPDAGTRTAEEIAIRNEMVACYLDYVSRLPPNYYEVYALSDLEDLSNEEIGHRLSLPVGTVKIRLHRARARLYEELWRHCRCYRNERGELMAEPKGRKPGPATPA